MKNEKTSKKVSSKAAKLMNEMDKQIAINSKIMVQLGAAFDALEDSNILLEIAKSVAASALTQTPDKKA